MYHYQAETRRRSIHFGVNIDPWIAHPTPCSCSKIKSFPPLIYHGCARPSGTRSYETIAVIIQSKWAFICDLATVLQIRVDFSCSSPPVRWRRLQLILLDHTLHKSPSAKDRTHCIHSFGSGDTEDEMRHKLQNGDCVE